MAMQAVPVTVENFIRAESDLYFSHSVRQGGFGKLHHNRRPSDVRHQTIVRMNRDTLYSSGVFDLDAGPVTVTMPETGKRFISFQVFDEDEYTPLVAYGAGRHVVDHELVKTRYAMIGVRILVDPSDPEDVGRGNVLQDAIRVEQARAGVFEPPNWDIASQRKIRDALLTLGETLPDSRRMFGRRDDPDLDPIRHLIGAATLWGGNPEKDATYLNVTPTQNDGKTVYRLDVGDVPVDGFWSVIVYDKSGYIPVNDRDVYSFNNLSAKRGTDGLVTIQFGGDPAKAPNCLPIVPGWNYTVRLYRPRPEILSGKWKFPEAQPIH